MKDTRDSFGKTVALPFGVAVQRTAQERANEVRGPLEQALGKL